MPREIVVNGRFLSRRVTGVERYGREILQRFPVGAYRLEKTDRNGLTGHAWEQFILPHRLGRESILWSPANTGPINVRDQALTIQDVSTLEHPEWFKPSFAAWYRIMIPLLERRVRAVKTPSEYVRQNILRRFPGTNVIASPSGVNTDFFHPGARRRLPHLPERYALFVGSLEPRKNLPALIHAWEKIQPRFPDLALIVAGATGNAFRAVALPHVGSSVIFAGHMDNDLPALYAGAEFFVLPSLDEGFGLPALEAMACGTPVIVSNGGALPEAVGDAGLIFSLDKPDTLASLIEECLTNLNLRATLIEKGLARAKKFSWHITAESIWNLLNEL